MKLQFLWILVTIKAVDAILRELSIGVFIEQEGDIDLYEHFNRGLTMEESEVPCVKNCNAESDSTSDQIINFSIRAQPVKLDSIDPFHIKPKVCSTLKKNFPLLISFASCQKNHVILEIANRHQVPILMYRPCDLTGSDLVLPPIESRLIRIEQTALKVIEHARWTEALIFYDKAVGADSLYILTEGLSSLGITAITIDTTQFTDIYIQQRRSTLQHLHNYITLCPTDSISALLLKARLTDLDLLGPGYFWLLIEPEKQRLDVNRISSSIREGDNVALIKHNEMQSKSAYKRILNSSVQIRKSLEKVPIESLANFSVDCFSNDSWDSAKFFSSTAADYLNACTCITSEDFQIHSFTVSHYAGAPYFMPVGRWNRSIGLIMDYYLYPFEHQGFNQRKFIVTAVHDPPFNIRHTNGSWSGVVIEMLNEMSRTLNFSYEIHGPPDGQWGISGENGSFNGMIGMLEREEADFGVGIFTVTESRHRVVDFTASFMIDQMVIIMQKPDLSETKMFLCLGPFSAEVWFSVIASVIGTGVVVWLVTRFHPLFGIATNEPPEVYSCWINIWQSIGALLQQGMVYVPSFHSARFVIALWWLFTIVVVGTYNGNLIAFLTAPKVSIDINNLNDLMQQSQMDIGLRENTAAQDLFQGSTSGIYKDVWDVVALEKSYNLVKSVADGFYKAKANPNFAFIVEKSYLEIMRKRPDMAAVGSPCDFVRSREEFLPSPYAFPFQKHSPYTQLFSKTLLLILEAGLIKHWRGLSYGNSNPCTGLERTTEQTTISLAEAQGAFYILAIGLFVSVASLAIEWIHTRKSTGKICLCPPKEKETLNGMIESYVGSMAFRPTIKPMSRKVPDVSLQRSYHEDTSESSSTTEHIDEDSTVMDNESMIYIVDEPMSNEHTINTSERPRSADDTNIPNGVDFSRNHLKMRIISNGTDRSVSNQIGLNSGNGLRVSVLSTDLVNGDIQVHRSSSDLDQDEETGEQRVHEHSCYL